MNADHSTANDPEIVGEIRNELMRAARKDSRPLVARLSGRLRRRIAVPVAIALALPVGAGIAFAASNLSDGSGSIEYAPIAEDGGPPIQDVTKGDIVGYQDLGSGELIRCSDGTPLTRQYGERAPACEDGTLPAVYVEQEAAWQKFLDDQMTAEVPEPPQNGPNFQVTLSR